MADKIKSSYKFSKSFYDDAITQGKWWSKLYYSPILDFHVEGAMLYFWAKKR